MQTGISTYRIRGTVLPDGDVRDVFVAGGSSIPMPTWHPNGARSFEIRRSRDG